MSVTLIVVQRYANTARNMFLSSGDVYVTSPEDALWLMNDAPGCFEYEVEDVVVEAETEETGQHQKKSRR